MPRVSRNKLTKKEIQEIAEHFSYLIASLTNSKQIENFLNCFLTEEEKVMLAKRLVLLMLIKRDISPSIICSTLNITYDTIRKYNNGLYDSNDLFGKTIENLVKRQKSKEFFNKLEKLFKPLDLILRAKTNIKARSEFASGDWE